ncbi:MAG: hypothetical protein M1371_06580 [Actinobacteria bacterium]|nr:hypothetical protein [Actinomycetota bacterium]
MAKNMTSRERVMRAYRREIPDRVPVCPDISNMIPCKLTGKPFWEIYLYNSPALGDAYMRAVDYFGIDGWYIYGYLYGGNSRFYCRGHEDKLVIIDGLQINRRILRIDIVGMDSESITVKYTIDTPKGKLAWRIIYPASNPPWWSEKMIKDLDQDWPCFAYVLGEDWDYNPGIKVGFDKIEDRAVYALCIDLPVDWWFFLRQGDQQQLIFDLMDREKDMLEIFAFYQRYAEAKVRAFIEAGPDEIVFQGSASSLSVISPQIYRKFNLPFIKVITALCREAGVISHQHTCGRSNEIIEINYHETELDVMEPLEPPPGGDVDLAEAKRIYGDKFCLKGGVNTFDVMRTYKPEEVGDAVRKCINDAATNGGYILSTGDQCPLDTPEENILKLVEVARAYGRYDFR